MLEKQWQIHRIRKLSVFARRLCAVFAAIYLTAATVLCAAITVPAFPSIKMRFATYTIATDQLTTPASRVTLLLLLAPYCFLIASGLRHLYRMFDDFTHGEIYTAASVAHIRHLGMLALATAVLTLLWPTITLIPLWLGIIDAQSVTRLPIIVSISPSSFVPFMTAGLVILVSWIMDVGRHTQEEAEQLRHDDGLVI
jgi:hypothetical protein